MKRFKARLVALCGLMVLAAAAAAPIVATAACYAVTVQCAGDIRRCSGVSDGSGHCVYSEKCLTCQ